MHEEPQIRGGSSLGHSQRGSWMQSPGRERREQAVRSCREQEMALWTGRCARPRHLCAGEEPTEVGRGSEL